MQPAPAQPTTALDSCMRVFGLLSAADQLSHDRDTVYESFVVQV